MSVTHIGRLGNFTVITKVRSHGPQCIPPAAPWTRKDQRLIDQVVDSFDEDDKPLGLIAASRESRSRFRAVSTELTHILQDNSVGLPANLRRRVSRWIGNHQQNWPC